MDDLCITCLCKGRNLIFIGGTELQQIYLQMLNEPVTKMLESYLQICWECQAILNRFKHFKNQTQRCYAELWRHVHQGPNHSIEKTPQLQVHNLYNISVSSVYKTAAKDDMHHEPETFVDEIKLEKKKRGRVKLKRTPKQKINKEKVKKEISRPSSDVSDVDVDQEDPFVETAPVSEVECKYCGKTFETQVELDLHTAEHEKETPKQKIKKEKVKKEISRPSSDVSDVDVDQEDPFVETAPVSEMECKDCGKTFETQVELDLHTAEHEKEDKVKTNGVARTRSKETLPDKPQCVECGKMFSSRKTYRYHLNVLHKGQNRYPCPRCGKVYQWKSNLGRHMRSHKALDSGELYCDICDKKFASVATFRQHLRGSLRHVSETDFSFMCNECGKKFVNKTRLRDHIDWEHLHNIKFKCQLCNKPFKCHTSLYVHLQNVHRNKEKKDNLCHVCGKSYQNAAKLRYHIVAMHTTETPYRCERCGAAFGWYSSLYRHVREVHHKMKVQPKKCKKTKKLSDGLTTPHLQQLAPME